MIFSIFIFSGKAQEVAKNNLESAHSKMKKLFDRQVENHFFLPGDQVLALLPIVTSPFQAKILAHFLW